MNIERVDVAAEERPAPGLDLQEVQPEELGRCGRGRRVRLQNVNMKALVVTADVSRHGDAFVVGFVEGNNKFLPSGRRLTGVGQCVAWVESCEVLLVRVFYYCVL